MENLFQSVNKRHLQKSIAMEYAEIFMLLARTSDVIVQLFVAGLDVLLLDRCSEKFAAVAVYKQ